MSIEPNDMKVCNDLELLHPHTRECALKVLKKCEEEGLSVGIFETLRSLARRKYLVSIGNSKTVNSYHGLGLAVDFVFKTAKGNWTWDRPKEDWDKLAEILNSCGFSPGWWWKTLKDGPHGQIDFEGVRSTTLYSKLAQVDNDLKAFYQYVDTLLEKDPRHSPQKPQSNITDSKEAEIVLEGNLAQNVVPPSEAKEPEALETAPPKQSILMIFLQFVLALFGGKK